MKVGTKIVCIDNTYIEDSRHTLTIDKTYIVEEFDLNIIYIRDDNGCRYGYMSSRFITLREKKLNDLV
jgi:hypothetical protein